MSAPARDTTTDQFLDRARLDHYFEVLEVPEEMRTALRRIAEEQERLRATRD